MKRVIGKLNPADKHVTIWGAGFSGLILGYYLKDQGYKITIHEKSNKVGGKIQTKKTQAGLVEKGPNALYMNADGMDLLKELKLEPLPAAKKLRRLLLIGGKPKRPVQLGILGQLAVHGHKKPPLIADGLTVAEFFRPLIGSENINQFLSPILGGIYATSSESLHFKSVFSEMAHIAQFNSYWDFIKLLIKNQKMKPRLDVSGSVSFEGGMQTLVNRLADVLKHDIKLNSKEQFKIKGNTILCTDAITASELTHEFKPEISTELARVKYQELSSVTVFLKREIKSLQKSFGVLIPLESGFNSIGVINNKATFPANNENVFSYTFIARKKLSEAEVYSDIKMLYSEFVEEDLEYMEQTHWDKALPIYDLQRYLSVKKLHQLAKGEENFAIFGNYVAGISLREMISAARAFAQNPQEYKEIR
ncbi:protoporphyrinogen/coproporphyrinogen oxidase [Peredibacter starrii]|uniref:FAD-dependent oxidoreductase n=1 Tax=Peredibacter starrii TaxID=28202 RepID=A0AAX4HSG2_9BACT|nr:FAD-dependent oxidoreductase [Peredibacter starrii]WPU66147.1 FAD-dependent oxidoreductase [Peredibacter starrii]